MDWIILLAAIFCCALATVGFALAVDPAARKKMVKWRCLTAIARRKKSLKRRLAAEKLKLLKEWDRNPAQQCAAAFVEELSQITDKTSGELRAEIVANAIAKAKNQQWDFVERFGQKYDQLIQINTKSVATQMAKSLPENAEYIMQNTALDDQAKDAYFDGEIRKALAKGTSSLNKIKSHIRKLEQAFIRFEKICKPGWLKKYADLLVRGATGAAVGWIGIDSNDIIGIAADFTSKIWNDFEDQSDGEFLNNYQSAINEMPLVCQAMNKNVRENLSEAIDGYIAYRREQAIKSLEVLTNLAEAGWDVRPALRVLV